MIAIRIVVCPVDFSPATARQVDLAVDVCRAFGARLVLHHNVTDVSVGAAVGWMWHAAHEAVVPPVNSVDDQLRAVVRQVPDGIDVETCITRGGACAATSRFCCQDRIGRPSGSSSTVSSSPPAVFD